MYPFLVGFLLAGSAIAQVPAILDVRNAGSVAADTDRIVAPEMLITIFGTNLADSIASVPGGSRWPTELAGASVKVNGLSAPLLYASPSQINAQVPSALNQRGQLPASARIVVTTSAGASAPFDLSVNYTALGIFTQSADGCGQGAVFNIHPDGSIALNSLEDSFDPDKDLGFTVFLTGLGAFNRTDGVPWTYDPAVNRARSGVQALGAFVGVKGITQSSQALNFSNPIAYIGPAPGLVGVDQANIAMWRDAAGTAQIPEGCRLPLVLSDFSNSTSQIVNVSVRKGGGRCIDPSPDSLASVTWKKEQVTDANGTLTTESVEAQFLRDSLISFPRPTELAAFAGCCRFATPLVPKACPATLPRAISADAITVAGPRLAPITISPETKDGQTKYSAVLPEGTLRAGTYRVDAPGSAAVGGFTSMGNIAEPIRITTELIPGTRIQLPLNISWVGGDQRSNVRVRLIVRPFDFPLVAIFDQTVEVSAEKASAVIGVVNGGPFSLPFPIPHGSVELIVTQEPKSTPSEEFSARGLSLGGEQKWRYSFSYRDLKY